jgi:hypothetical protein
MEKGVVREHQSYCYALLFSGQTHREKRQRTHTERREIGERAQITEHITEEIKGPLRDMSEGHNTL